MFSSAVFDAVKIGQRTCLCECMNFIATKDCFESVCDTGMRRDLDNISSNMTEDQLYYVLDDYANFFHSIVQVIPVAENEMIDNIRISTFAGNSGINKCPEYKKFVYIMYSAKEKLFAPLYVVHTNGDLQTRFPVKNTSIIYNIYKFLQEWNIKSKYTK